MDKPATYYHKKLTIKTCDQFPELNRPNNSWSGKFLVAWFYHVWWIGNRTEAAKRFNVSITETYRRLYILERLLGKKLWIRFQRPFTLTPTGEQLINRYCGYVEH